MDDPFAITTAADDQQHPAAAWSAAGNEYLVAWTHSNGSDDDVHARRVGAGGGLLGTELTLASGSAEQRYPDLAYDAASGGHAVAWQAGATNADLYGAILDGECRLLGGEVALSTAGYTQERPAMAYDSDRGRFLVVWADYRHSSSAPDVYAQLARGYTVVINYDYDPLYRLVEARYSDGAYYRYGYDPVGNRTVYTDTYGEATTYAYDHADRLSSVTFAGVTTPYSWSDRGEILSDGAQLYEWDAAGRLVGARGPGDLEVGYSYDEANNRTGLEVNDEATSYIVDPFHPVDAVPQVLVETSGGEVTRYLYGLDLFAQEQDSAWA